MTGSVVVSIIATPAIYNVSGGGSYCSGGAGLAINLSNSQAGTNYQLILNGSNIISSVSGTGSLINFGNQTNSGTYTVTATVSGCSSNMNGNAVITVNPLPNTYNVTGGGSLCSGGSGLPIGLSGSQSGINYQLQINSINSGSLLPGNGSILNFGNKSTAGTYTIIATNPITNCKNNMSGPTIINVYNKISIISQPSNYTFCTGAPTSFNVSASGSAPLNYLWYKNSSPVPSQTSSSFTIGSITNNDAGTYYCLISNICGNITSTNATLTVNTTPTLTYKTADKIKCIRDSILFKVLFNGTSPTYQWNKNGNDIAGATNSSYLISLILITDAGSYSCKASNLFIFLIQFQTNTSVKEAAFHFQYIRQVLISAISGQKGETISQEQQIRHIT